MRLRNLSIVPILASAGCFSTHQKLPPAPAMSVEDARDVLRKAIETDKSWLDAKGEWHKCCAPATEVRVRTEGASYLKANPDGTAKVVRVAFDSPIEEYESFSAGFGICLGPAARLGGYRGDMPKGFMTKSGFHSTRREEIHRIAHAYNTLVAWNREHGEDEFAKLAAEWRANPSRALSAGGEKHRILAENAFREKDVERALAHFEDALESDPTWADGNFNLALLYGEMKEYALAARYMKRYLLLVPDSKDAKAANEKIIIWEDKATRAKPAH